jgi:hypothetical protein
VRGRGRGRGGGRGRGRGDADASWGHPPIVISKGADSTFDSHSRGEASTSASSAITARSEGTGKSDWGNANFKDALTSDSTGSLPVASDNSDAQIASGWGSGQGSGWGGDMADSGWGNTGTSGNNGWGDSGGNGWGSTGDTGWGSTGDNEGSRKNSGWGSTRGTKDAGGTTPSPSPAATQRGEDETMNSSASAAFTETVKPIPLPSRKASSSHLQPPVSSKQITDPPHIPLKIRPMSLGDTVVPSPVIVPASARPRETLTRVQVYSNTIKYVVSILPTFQDLIVKHDKGTSKMRSGFSFSLKLRKQRPTVGRRHSCHLNTLAPHLRQGRSSTKSEQTLARMLSTSQIG